MKSPGNGTRLLIVIGRFWRIAQDYISETMIGLNLGKECEECGEALRDEPNKDC